MPYLAKCDRTLPASPHGAAQRVKHFEISGYTTTKNLAQQLRHSALVELLSKAEEENSESTAESGGPMLDVGCPMPAMDDVTTEDGGV